MYRIIEYESAVVSDVREAMLARLSAVDTNPDDPVWWVQFICRSPSDNHQAVLIIDDSLASGGQKVMAPNLRLISNEYLVQDERTDVVVEDIGMVPHLDTVRYFMDAVETRLPGLSDSETDERLAALQHSTKAALFDVDYENGALVGNRALCRATPHAPLFPDSDSEAMILLPFGTGRRAVDRLYGLERAKSILGYIEALQPVAFGNTIR